jgi:hypothetical protein
VSEGSKGWGESVRLGNKIRNIALAMGDYSSSSREKAIGNALLFFGVDVYTENDKR